MLSGKLPRTAHGHRKGTQHNPVLLGEQAERLPKAALRVQAHEQRSGSGQHCRGPCHRSGRCVKGIVSNAASDEYDPSGQHYARSNAYRQMKFAFILLSSVGCDEHHDDQQ